MNDAVYNERIRSGKSCANGSKLHENLTGFRKNAFKFVIIMILPRFIHISGNLLDSNRIMRFSLYTFEYHSLRILENPKKLKFNNR